jgi:flagellar biosynthesis protein FlhF
MMNIHRFHAPTSREALAKARMTFGEGTMILSNRPTATGVEVMAAAEDALANMSSDDLSITVTQEQSKSVVKAQAEAQKPLTKSVVEEDADQLAMSTLSFQDYVRERMLRRRQASLKDDATSQTIRTALKKPEVASQESAQRVENTRRTSFTAKLSPGEPGGFASDHHQNLSISSELQAMKDLIEDRFNTLSWLGQTRQSPIQSKLMLKLIRAGFSPSLARTVLERLPAGLDATQSVRWIMDVLECNLKTDTSAVQLHQQGGAYALVGATGVGKTTTAAKLAGLCARNYGAESVGLITLDTYRVGAHEQLRHYGRMLGVVAHMAHDRAALQDLLNLLANKKMVLIDTTGIAPRDPRKIEQLSALDLPNVNRLLVLNAGAHGDTLDDMVTSFKGSGIQQTILSKIDEAVKLGPALDAVIRHHLVLRGITNGQKVPEDWEPANAAQLVRIAMRPKSASAFDPQESDLGFIFNTSSAQQSRAGDIHA